MLTFYERVHVEASKFSKYTRHKTGGLTRSEATAGITHHLLTTAAYSCVEQSRYQTETTATDKK